MYLSSPILTLGLFLTQALARCLPGSDWHSAGSSTVFEDFGADTFTTAYLNITYVDPETNRVHSVKSEVAKYGDGPIRSADGLLVHVTGPGGGHTACEGPLRSSLGSGDLPTSPWIALIQRGHCNFEFKIENAFRAGALAAVVYNDREAPTLDKMKLTSATRNISAVFTFKWKGEELARLVDRGIHVQTQISVATHCTRPHAHINRTSVLFVSISFIVLMVISLAWLVFYYVQRFRYTHAKNRLSRRLCSAAKKALSRIPVKQLERGDREVQGDGECCAVCIEPYRVSDDLRILPCSHEFHKSCIDPWLLEHRTCPMCKMDILKHYGYVFTGSQESILQINEDERSTSSVSQDPHAGSRVVTGIVRSEPVSRVSTPESSTAGQYYTLGDHKGACCPACPHRRPSVPTHLSSLHVPRLHEKVDRARLLLDPETFYQLPISNMEAIPNESSKDSGSPSSSAETSQSNVENSNANGEPLT